MNTITKLGISSALVFIIAELTYINSKSLLYIVGHTALIDKIFAVVGSLGFSTVTVLVMRNSVLKWPKLLFPIFDSCLIFFGFNVSKSQSLFEDPVRLFLTIFMALFAGLITYSLGIINYKKNSSKEEKLIAQYKERCNNLGLKLDEFRAEIVESGSEREKSENDLLETKKILEQQNNKMQQITNELQQATAKLQQQENELLQFKIARTCPHCSEEFESEAALRSHKGRCKMRAA
jgi:hypothetical protein